MKLKTRLIIAFITIIALPIVLTIMVVLGFGSHQINAIDETYGIKGTTYKNLSNSIQVLNQLTKDDFEDLLETGKSRPYRFTDESFLEEINTKLQSKNSYLMIRKGNEIVFSGVENQTATNIEKELPKYDDYNSNSENGIYIGADLQVLIKQIDFKFLSGEERNAFIITDVSDIIPEVRQFVTDVIIAVILILVFTAIILIWWIQRGILGPLEKMREAAQNIKEGNLNFQMDFKTEDELGQLCRDFEEMRQRLLHSAEEKLAYDKANKELISNISHDLKTPITSIKGYVEGIMDGVADTPEKVDKYVRTIYNKANEMDLLINELTMYSKIDTNKIPYNFSTISVNAYFDDCAEDLLLELEAKNILFSYLNKVEGDPKIIADPEQLKRVIHNIVNNSVKYMDKEQGCIMLRVTDVGDFIQVEIEDNGEGIPAKDLANIFERFYRTDTSRNSTKGGSGIGLSIVKKVIEEHGGKIWATSKEGSGTIMYFVVRKYQEVPMNG